MASETSMRAVVQRRYGPPSVLEHVRLERPRAGRGEVLVEVHAASVSPGDCFVSSGLPYLIRPVFGFRRPRQPVPGRDFAGVVVDTGADVDAVAVGDAVFGWTTAGVLAEFARVDPRNIAVVPDGMSMVEASAIATSGMTALQALRDVARLQPGQKLLVIGGSGGVGSFAIQIAVALGAEVTAVASTRNLEVVRSLGALHAVDYTTIDITRSDQRFDVILDNVEDQRRSALRRVLTPTGTLIPNSGHGGRWVGPLGRIVAAHIASCFTRQRLKPFASVGRRDDLLALAILIESGQLRPLIDRTYPLSDAAAAMSHVSSGHARGKVVVAL